MLASNFYKLSPSKDFTAVLHVLESQSVKMQMIFFRSTGREKRINQLKQNVEFRKKLCISMARRINAIKMVVLLRFLSLFQTISSFIALSYFKQLDSIIAPFLWCHKAVRISKKHLIKPKMTSGFGLPQFKTSYWVANLNILVW